MSNHSIEEDQVESKLFNLEVVKLLFKYISRYRLHLLLALFFVTLITATTLTVPYLSRIIIDRMIVKQGHVALKKQIGASGNSLLLKSFSKAEPLGNDTFFLFQNQLSKFSSQEIKDMIRNGSLSEEKFTLIESPVIAGFFKTKVDTACLLGYLLPFDNNRFLLTGKGSPFFTGSEMLQLRAADLKKTGLFVICIIGLFIIQFFAAYMQIITLMKLSQNAMRDLRTDLYNHIHSLELSFFDSNPVGKLVNRITNDIESLNELFSTVLITLVQDVLIMSGIAVIMYATDPRLALIVSISFPLLFAGTVIFRRKARAAYRTIRSKITDLNSFLNENISNIKIVQIFTREERQLTKFKSINNSVYKANIAQLNIYAVFRPLIDFFRWFSVGIVIFFAASFFIEGRMSYGLIVMFLTYIGHFFEPIGDLAEKFDILQSATAAGEKILSIFKTMARNESSVNLHHLTILPQQKLTVKNEIVFDDVWFSYVPGEWVLKGVSFSVPAQSTLAIVGETGSGKSTIINLLSRFYDLQKGNIRIDGADISTLPYPYLRSGISTVMQDVFLFSRTVKENIILGNLWDEDKFNKVVSLTHANNFISRLPEKHMQPVMERGATFSAGERQLLAFTRALYADPSILILDEATSNIDTETEVLIQDAISRLIRGRTSIVIAHRLSTIRSADRIIVLDKGKIAENGNHQELMDLRGLYYDLYRIQFNG
jgi:ABC-type multidrug transport system fused ATPase/permease subunit